MPTEPVNPPRRSWQRCWPTEFTKPRKYNRQEENKSYLGFLEWLRETVENDLGSDDEECEDAVEDEENMNNKEHEKSEQNCDKENGKGNKVRIFMTGALGEDGLLSHDEVMQVTGFCEQVIGDPTKPVALLDDRKNGGNILVGKGDSRPYLGPLTAEQLMKELSKQRLNNPINVFDDEEEVDADRRLLFVNDVDPGTVEAIVTTAARSHAPALKNLFYRHLLGKATIGVDLPSQGFQVFTLHINLPYYVLREHKELLKDPRMYLNGRSLRRSWESRSLSQEFGTVASSSTVDCLYEAHLAVTVTGIDTQVWTAYCFVDTYFDTNDSVESYHETTRWGSGRADPFAAGFIDGNFPIREPREYFAKIVELRARLIAREWTKIIDKAEREIEQSSTWQNDFIMLASDPKVQQEKRQKIQTWVSHKMTELRRYKRALSSSIEAWKEFQQTDIEYFEDIEHLLSRSIETTGKAFSDLKEALRKAEAMREELAQDYPQGLHAQLSFETNEVQVFQLKSANQTKVLTYITIAFIPVVAATSLFSMQVVLPFKPTLTHFTYVLVALIILVGAVIVAVLKWNSSLWPMLQYALRAMMCVIFESLRLGREMAYDVKHGGRAIEWAIFSRQRRTAGDLENGIHIALDDLQ